MTADNKQQEEICVCGHSKVKHGISCFAGDCYCAMYEPQPSTHAEVIQVCTCGQQCPIHGTGVPQTFTTTKEDEFAFIDERRRNTSEETKQRVKKMLDEKEVEQEAKGKNTLRYPLYNDDGSVSMHEKKLPKVEQQGKEMPPPSNIPMLAVQIINLKQQLSEANKKIQKLMQREVDTSDEVSKEIAALATQLHEANKKIQELEDLQKATKAASDLQHQHNKLLEKKIQELEANLKKEKEIVNRLLNKNT